MYRVIETIPSLFVFATQGKLPAAYHSSGVLVHRTPQVLVHYKVEALIGALNVSIFKIFVTGYFQIQFEVYRNV